MEQPFLGVLWFPGKLVPHGISPVFADDRTTVAQLRWHLSIRGAFEILDAGGTTVVARGRAAGFRLRRYSVNRVPDGAPVVTMQTPLFSPMPNNVRAQFATGRTYRVQGLDDRQQSGLYDGSTEVGLMGPGSTDWLAQLIQTDAVRFELRAPVLTMLEAIGIAQCIRAASRRQRRS